MMCTSPGRHPTTAIFERLRPVPVSIFLTARPDRSRKGVSVTFAPLMKGRQPLGPERIRSTMDAKKILLGLCATAAFHLVLAQGPADPVLMTVDGQPVTRSEFEAIYKKNNKDVAVTQQALDEYLELFINYKLKVREAETLGMDTVSKFTAELDGYRKQLARPYLIDRELNENLMREAFERGQEEIRASHLLVQVAGDASPEDTLAAWKRILALRDRVMKGEDIGDVARSKGGSDDPSALKNGGDLGWFSALQMVYPFENAAYATKVGEVSNPVRTRFGYHIIKVTGRRPARGQVRVAHVMVRSTDQDGPERQQQAEQRMREVHAQVVGGKLSFADAALRYSEDEGSSTKGGELPQFGTGKMIEEFEDVAFGLSADGEVSQPFQTRYGWHIVKRLEYIAPAGYEQAKAELKSKIARDSRADITRKAFIEQLRKEYKYSADPRNLKPLVALLDSSIFQKGSQVVDTMLRKDVVEGLVKRGGRTYRREVNGTVRDGKLVNVRSRKHDDMEPLPTDTVVVRDVQEGWTYDRAKAAKLTKPVFTITGRSYSQRDFLDHLESRQKREPAMPFATYLDQRFKEYVEEEILRHEDAQLETKYPEFRLLMKEYRDGILLFELTDQMVWSRAVKDTAGLEAFHQAHERDHMWDTRYEADLYTCANADVAKKVRALHKKGRRGDAMLAEVNRSSALDLDVQSGLFTADEKPYLKGLSKPGLSNNIDLDGRVLVVDLKRIVPPQPKSLSEARGSVTAAYQDELEKAWVTELRAKYPVQVNKEVLYTIQ